MTIRVALYENEPQFLLSETIGKRMMNSKKPTAKDLNYISDILSNDEYSSDDEIKELIRQETEIREDFLAEIMAFRNVFLINPRANFLVVDESGKIGVEYI
jgi:hypothetical protein